VTRDPGRQRKSDLRLLLGATIGILLGGVIIAAAILAVTSRGAVPSTRKPIAFGLATAVHENVKKGGPVNIAGASGDTGFWVALENGKLVALLVHQPKPQSCTLRWRGSLDSFLCDGRKVAIGDLARYRSFVSKSGPTEGLYMVALRDVQPGPGATTTSTTTAPTPSPAP
jgi:hypothetical protein